MELRAWLTAKAPQARSLEAVRGAVPFEVVCDLPSAEGATRVDSGASGSRDRARETYETCLLQIPAAIDPEALARAITAPETGVIRAKGFVTARDGSVHTIQIAGARFEIARATTTITTPHAIVCIGLKGRIAPAAIEAAIRGSEAA